MPNLVWQLLAAVLFMTAVLFVLGVVADSTLIWAVGVGALSSSTCIVFATPTGGTAKPSRIFGGYVVGLLTGLIVHILYLLVFKDWLHLTGLHNYEHLFWTFASVTVGLTMFLMVLFGFEHPPAVGISLVLVIDMHHYKIVIVILLFVLVLVLLRWGFRHHLKNLIGDPPCGTS